MDQQDKLSNQLNDTTLQDQPKDTPTIQQNDTPLTTEQTVTPWDVKGATDAEGKVQAIDYDRLINHFGCQRITPELIARFERVTGKKAHHFLRRGIFFSHRDLDTALTYYEQGKPIYLYTGRGPSSESMHLGHMVPFIFCKYLQDALDAHLVIQLTDDEKCLFKEGLTLAQTTAFAYENAKDIIAVGFNPAKTFMFVDSEYYGYMFDTILAVQKAINFNQASSVFGFTPSDSIGKIAFPATEIAPAFAQSFRHLFGDAKDVACLIPCAIDQDNYFRLGRDLCHKFKAPKTSVVHSVFFPALQGPGSKMSASDANSAIYMTDTAEQIKSKINRYAFSGGRDTLEEHRRLGGNPDVDVAFQYLRFFLPDDERLDSIRQEYLSGRMLTGDLKKQCIAVLQKFVADFQAARAAITPAYQKLFMELPLTARERKMQAEIDSLKAKILELEQATQ